MLRPLRPRRRRTRLTAGAVTLLAAGLVAGLVLHDAPAPAEPSPPGAADAAEAPGGNPYSAGFYARPDSPAALAAAAAGAEGRTQDADDFAVIAARSTSLWLADPHLERTGAAVTRYAQAAAEAGGTGTLVLYAIPERDLCGRHSAGGSVSYDDYRTWVVAVADALAASGAAGSVTAVLEPDALSETCGGGGGVDALMAQREAVIGEAVDLLNAAGIAAVYLDAGNSRWTGADLVAARLAAAGVGRARGWASNVSNFAPTADEVAYDEAIRAALGGAGHYVIDTSRNGAAEPPVAGDWCNPAAAGLGTAPTATADGGALDATLDIKTTGTSDGSGGACGDGAPVAGTWYPDYARQLVTRAAG